MNAAARESARIRAQDRCEYCLLQRAAVPSSGLQDLDFHVEHIIPRQHGGASDMDNLAWACDRCNLCKGTNLTGIDPATGNIALLYHPRRSHWSEHFRLEGFLIVGTSDTGRASVRLLNMNAPNRVKLRTPASLQ